MRNTAVILLSVTVLAAISHQAHASIVVTYSDKATFLAVPGVTSLTGTIPNLGNVGPVETLGDVTFSTLPFAEATNMDFGNRSTLISGNEIAISGTERIDVSINRSEAVRSFGFEFHEPTATNVNIDGTNTPFFHDSTFDISLYLGATLIDTTTFSPDNDTLTFFGLTSTTAFDRVRISERLAGIQYGNGIDISNDNEFFGEFYASSFSTIPEPATIAVWSMIGLCGMGYRARRKIKESASRAISQ